MPSSPCPLTESALQQRGQGSRGLASTWLELANANEAALRPGLALPARALGGNAASLRLWEKAGARASHPGAQRCQEPQTLLPAWASDGLNIHMH